MRKFEFLGRKFSSGPFALLCSALCFALCAQSAQSAVSIKPVGAPAAAAEPAASAPVPAAPTRAATPTRISGGTLQAVGAGISRGSSTARNTIGKYLKSSANILKPGSVVKVPSQSTGSAGAIPDMSGYVTQVQYDYLENIVNGLQSAQADMSEYYKKSETDDLLDDKLDIDAIIAGSNVTITNNNDGTLTIAATGGSGTGTNGREVVLRNNGTHLQWKYNDEPDSKYQDLIAIAALTGDDGRDVSMRFDNGWLQWQLDGDPDWQSLVNMDNYETISNKSTSSSVATDTGSETKYTSVAAVEALISDAIDDIDVSDKQDKASAVSAGNVALWASDGKGKYQTAGEVGIATTLDKDDAAYNGAKLVPSNLVADMAVPPLDPTCIDASNNFNQCVLSQDMNGPGGTLQWVWLRMAE